MGMLVKKMTQRLVECRPRFTVRDRITHLCWGLLGASSYAVAAPWVELAVSWLRRNVEFVPMFLAH
jgi:hypothetical protein